MMQMTRIRFLFCILLIPLVFRFLERINGPWPIPFKWPNPPADISEYDVSDRRYLEAEELKITWEKSTLVEPSYVCRYGRNCLPNSVKIPMKIAIAPRVGLASCIVGGILAAELEALTCYLERVEVIGSRGNKLPPKEIDRFCGATNKFHSITEMSKNIRVRLRDMKSWKFIMLTRDPIERFINGFIKYCILQQNFCYGCGSDLHCFADTYLVRMQQFAMYNEENYNNMSEMDWDLFPQTWMCDVEQWRDKYTLLHFSSNLSPLIGNLTSILGEKYFPSIDRILRSSSVREHLPGPSHYSELMTTIQSSRQLQTLLAMMYHNDYKVLNYKMLI